MRLKRKPRLLGACLIVLLAGFAWACHGTTDADETCSNPAVVKRHADGIAGQWFVVYQNSVSNPDQRTTELASKYGFVTLFRYETAIKGFAAKLPDATVEALRCEAGIDFIEQDGTASLAYRAP